MEVTSDGPSDSGASMSAKASRVLNAAQRFAGSCTVEDQPTFVQDVSELDPAIYHSTTVGLKRQLSLLRRPGRYRSLFCS